MNDTNTSKAIDVLKLYDDYESKIFHYVLHRTGDVEAARDITAEVFFKAHENRWRFQFTVAPISAWLFRIAGNEVSSFHRRKRYRPFCLETELTRSEMVPFSLRGDLRDEILNAQERVSRNAAFFRVLAELLKLPDKYQEVIVLHYLEEKTVPEIAEILGKRQGTVKSLISRGIRKLRTVMGRAQDPFSDERLLAKLQAEKGVNVL
jgi:RNA polymerase sigma-70 factor, ECF subfamily